MEPITLTVVTPDVIEQALVKENITDTVIAGLQQYRDLTILGVEDKAGYKAVDEARKQTKTLRVLAGKICKAGREDAVAIQKAWIAKEKEVTGKISEVEDDLSGKLAAIDAEKERLAAEAAAKVEADRKAAEEAEAQRVQARVDELAQYNHTAPFLTVRNLTDEDYAALLTDAKTAFEAKRAEAKRIADEAAAEAVRVAKERAELEEQRIEQQRRDEEQRKQQEEIRQQKEQLFHAKIQARASELFAFGFEEVQQQGYKHKQYPNCATIGYGALADKDANGWGAVIEDVKSQIEFWEKEAEKEKKEAAAKADRIRQQQAEAAEAQRLKDIEDAKEAERLCIQRQQEQKEREENTRKAEEQRQLALRPDKEKLLEYGTKIVTIPQSTLTSTEAQTIAAEIKRRLEAIQTYINKAVKEL